VTLISTGKMRDSNANVNDPIRAALELDNRDVQLRNELRMMEERDDQARAARQRALGIEEGKAIALNLFDNSTEARQMLGSEARGGLRAPTNQLPGDEFSQTRQWLASANAAKSTLMKTNDPTKFRDTLTQLEDHLDRIGGANVVSKDMKDGDSAKLFDELSAAIAKNQYLSISDKDDARQALAKMQERFD
jgi:hypothetical protein